MAIKPEHVVNLQGRDYVLYGGLLAEAHERGLKGIDVQLVQIPGPDNEYTAIVKATVIMAEGETFVDYGDASPRNTNSRIATALIRMASTRGKGRALRDAVNIGTTMLEELPEPEGPGAAANGKARAREAVTGAEKETVAQQVAPPAGGAAGCEVCGMVLTAGMVKASQANFSKRLCPAHQKEAQAAKQQQAAAPK